MRVVCKRATTKQQLQEMRGSKFVQSDLGNIFQDIKKELKEGTTILFSGTPCQVAGLLSFLRKNQITFYVWILFAEVYHRLACGITM